MRGRVSCFLVCLTLSTAGALAAACAKEGTTTPSHASPNGVEPAPDGRSVAAPAVTEQGFTEPSAAPHTPAAAAPTSAKLVLPAEAGKAKFRTLDIEVVELVEKRLMDGSGMMRATLRLRSGDKDETIQLTSDDPKLTWNGYELEYQGGWRQEVQLSVRWLSQ